METTRAVIAIYKINYKSDFILTVVCDVEWETPFCIKFWTGEPSQAYYVGWTGHEYKNCKVVESDPSKLLVLFDDHHLPVGELKMQIVYHTTIEDFPNAIVDEVTNSMKVMAYIDGKNQKIALDFEGEEDAELQFELPAYANEAQRIANEEQRIANEQARIEAEQQRIDNEQTRQDNEAQRIAQETARVNEYAELKANAVAATNAANDAATLADQKAQLAADKAVLADAAATLAAQKAQLAADKAALADAAATLAAQKAQLAADKAALADAAATLANQKAALAQQKAEYAQTQGDYAKAQGDYAKEQGEIAEEDHERAEADHTRAESDHATAGNDHTQAGTDHSTAVNDHTQADTDHTRAESDHTQATSDHTQAGADHTRAESDHTTASDDHTQAGQDHTRAEADHTRAESDHAAVEVYVDSLGAFDISAYHATGGVLAKYADLTAALGTNGANIPEAIRKGGMSVKFVQTYDNKYVQFRCMAQNFTTDVTDWQGIDDEPTTGSDNLVKSGGVYTELTKISEVVSRSLLRSKKAIAVDQNINYYAGNVSLETNKTYLICIVSDKNLQQRSVWASATTGGAAEVTETFFAHDVDYYDLSKVTFIEFTPSQNATGIFVSMHNSQVSGDLVILVVQKNEILFNNNIFDLIDWQDLIEDKLSAVVNDNKVSFNIASGYQSVFPVASLQANKHYKIYIQSFSALNQSNLYLSTSNGQTLVDEAIAHFTSEDLQQVRIIDYIPSANSNNFIISIENVSASGILHIWTKEIGEYIDSSDIVTRNEFKTVHGGGNLSSIVGSALVANIPNVPVSLHSSLIYDSKNIKLCGKIWGYSTDPNGVYPADKGSILQLPNKSTDNGDYLLNPFPAILVTEVWHTSGIIEEIGINGYANDSDSRGLFDISDVSKHAGIHVAANSPVDQFRINHINCQGLGVGVSIINTDASHIDRINADGCDVGIYLGGGAFTGIENCILSDTLSYGLLIWGFGELGNVVGARILNNVFTRNGYNISAEQFPNIPQYSVCLKMDSSYFRGNHISSAGFWHKFDEGEEYLYNYNIGGLYIQGNSNIVSNNIISTLNDSTAFTLEINGNNNVIDDSNIISGKVKISGSSNILKYISGVTDIYVTANAGNIIDPLYDSSIIHYL